MMGLFNCYQVMTPYPGFDARDFADRDLRVYVEVLNAESVDFTQLGRLLNCHFPLPIYQHGKLEPQRVLFQHP